MNEEKKLEVTIGNEIKFKGYTTEFLYGVVKDIKVIDESPIYICHHPSNSNSNIMVVMAKNIIEVMEKEDCTNEKTFMNYYE